MTWRKTAALAALILGLFSLIGCFGRDAKPDSPPDDPVERAAYLGLRQSYESSTMWQIRDVRILGVRAVVPSKAFVQEHDPREVYCVCVYSEVRYKVPWTTEDESEWDEAVRNVLVIRTQGGEYLALKPSGLCPQYCQ